ncbi:MAG TPA: bifunctional lysylphosphatidylglycerol flippase/synthetase MprF [Bacillota bacterium]|nr:bifunctional lysylphosphatidylglycerol flippase/synthetase MprF [Bacillota bacterium]
MKWMKGFFNVLIIAIIIFEGHKFIREIRLGETIYLLRRTGLSYWLLFAGLGCLGILAITSYDLVWFHFNKREIKSRTIVKTAWIASAINNVMGMGGLTGAFIRTVFYKKANIEDIDILKINVLLVPSSITGLSILMWYNLRGVILHAETLAIKEHPVILLVLVIFCLYILLYLLSEFIPFPFIKEQLTKWGFIGSFKLKISLVAASTVEWSAAALFLWAIADHIKPGISINGVIFFFAVSAAVGLLSFIPAGFGSFDLMMIFGLQAAGLRGAEAAGALILFRVFYYFIPLIIASLLAVVDAIPNGNGFPMLRELSPFWEKIGRRNGVNEYQFDILKDFTIVALWLLMIAAASIMVISTLTPEIPERIHFLLAFFSVPFLRFSNGATLLSGLILFILSDAIKLRVKRAYYISMGVLFAGGIFNLLKGFNFEELIVFAAVILVLRYSKDKFYRVSIPRSWGRLFKQTVMSQLVVALYMLSGQSTPFSFYHLHRYQTPDDYFNNGIVLSIAIQILIVIWFFVQNQKAPWSRQTKSEIYGTLDRFICCREGNALTHLIYSGDKYLYASADGRALIAFRPYKDKLVALGDPIGDLENFTDYLEEFRRYADLYGYLPIFYQVCQESLTKYHEIGYTFFKLGEEAYVDLNSFDLGDRRYKAFRNTRNRMEREGVQFAVSEPTHSGELLNELEKLSQEWLGRRREKGFSLGRFDRGYLNRSQIALLKDAGGKVTAFASIMPFYDKKTLSVDLMRFSKDSPSGSMDYLFMNLLQWAKERGFTSFNLGMAPLSNVGESQYALKEEKAARQLFNYGGAFYHFKGLRKYKEKFDPEWYPKYLAYPKQLRITPLLIDISIMVSRSYKNHIKE